MKTVRLCTAEGCEQPYWSTGFCKRHYAQHQKALKASTVCGVDGCDTKQFATGICYSHWYRRRTYGDVNGGNMPQATRTRWLWFAVFACLATRTDECVIQPFAPDATGYGVVCYKGKSLRMHQAVLLLTGRKPPTGHRHHSRHLCGNSGCINPFHIVVGTAKENSGDAMRHGTTPRGENHVAAKLTEAAVRDIRTSSEPQRVLAERYGVNQGYVSDIRNRRKWAWLVD